MGILLSLVVLSLVVFVHEYGHYVAMRRNGVKVVEFTIGFGPTLWSRTLKSGTAFHLKIIPLGGYTKPVAEGEGSMGAASRWARFKICFAGPLANAIAAFAVLLPAFYLVGYPEIVDPYVAWAPGPLQPLVAAFGLSFGLVLATPVLFVWLIATKGLALLKGMAGPVGIVAMGSDAASSAQSPLGVVVAMVVYFVMINVALGGTNLLPFHPLDGGRIAELLIEKFGGKRKETFIKVFRIAGLGLFLLLIIAAFSADFLRLAGRL